jgi:hypothetical protein
MNRGERRAAIDAAWAAPVCKQSKITSLCVTDRLRGIPFEGV